MVTFTFIRHGESTDNLRAIWAGWRDAPLSNHGMNQARALGISLADTQLTAIHTSDLKRALTTAQEVLSRQGEPKPRLVVSSLLREQHFGIAEGKPYQTKLELGLSPAEHVARGMFPPLYDSSDKFPEGESREDLARRAEQVIEEIVLPYVWRSAEEGLIDLHVAVVSHGLCIRELVSALVRKGGGGETRSKDYKGLRNTAWTRLTIEVKGASSEFPGAKPLSLVMRVTDMNNHDHLATVVRQKGGIGSAAYDSKQRDIHAFFGGGTTTIVEGRKGLGTKEDE